MVNKKDGIDIKRNAIETEIMTIRSFIKNNRKIVLLLTLFLLAVSVITISCYAVVSNISENNLVRYEKIVEKYRLNLSDDEVKKETIKELNELVKSSGVGIAIDLSYYELGNIYFDNKEFVKSAESLGNFIDRSDSEDILKPMAVNKMAISYEENGKIDEALKVLVEYEAGSSKSIAADQILYNMGRLYQKKGDKVKAKSAFERLIKTYPGSFYSGRAKERIFLLDSK